jgi:hypothetical protein
MVKKSVLLLFTATVLLGGAIQAAAQTATPQPPPPVLWIFNEDVKASRGSAHEQFETGYVRALQKAKWPVYSLAMTSIAGPNVAWFVSGYPSFAAWEKDRHDTGKNAELSREFDRLDAGDAEFRTNQRGMVARFREDLSYNANTVIAQMRYFQVTITRVRPGHTSDWEEARKMLNAALKQAGGTGHNAVYQVAAGSFGTTFIVFTPRKSLAEMDPNPEFARAMREATGEDYNKKRDKLLSDSVIQSDTSLFAFSPKMSYVSDEFAKAGGEDFWRPKSAMAAKPVMKKPAPKAPATGQ